MRALAAVQVAFAAFMGLSICNAKSLDHGQAGAQALELAKRAIALRSVRGPGNQTPEVASLFKSDRKSTRLNSSHSQISYAVFCLKKKKSPDGTPFPADRQTGRCRRQL